MYLLLHKLIIHTRLITAVFYWYSNKWEFTQKCIVPVVYIGWPPPWLRHYITPGSYISTSNSCNKTRLQNKGRFLWILSNSQCSQPLRHLLGAPVSSTNGTDIPSSFHRLDMTLAVAKAWSPNIPNQLRNLCNFRLKLLFSLTFHLITISYHS